MTHQPRTRPRVVSKVFDNSDFGFQKITVERPLRLNFAVTPERIEQLENRERRSSKPHQEQEACSAHSMTPR